MKASNWWKKHLHNLRDLKIGRLTKERLVRWLVFGLAGGLVPLFAKAFGYITAFGEWPPLIALLRDGELVTTSIALAFIVMEQVLSSENRNYRTLRLSMGGVILVFAIACAFMYSSISSSTAVSQQYRMGASLISFVVVGVLIGPAVIMMTGKDVRVQRKKKGKIAKKRKEKNVTS